MTDFDPEAMAEALTRAVAAAAPHLAAAGRELVAAGKAFLTALTEDPESEVREHIPVE